MENGMLRTRSILVNEAESKRGWLTIPPGEQRPVSASTGSWKSN